MITAMRNGRGLGRERARGSLALIDGILESVMDLCIATTTGRNSENRRLFASPDFLKSRSLAGHYIMGEESFEFTSVAVGSEFVFFGFVSHCAIIEQKPKIRTADMAL